ncbi:putative ABC exporter domain-containing protein [Rhodopirellula sp. P2]|uniref:putative ABC exporter domain-containing protein n=1 Tax=Rhodopirellula sp. P2 TaxID=2127060 RepID=UPI0023675080|nr:putative ABC exporter domain-containing protein [Rhodopirellula sp. P2]WDQ16043.1 putative ABC exporter domain-containing protein [Rhodopirellula sp. P2]
MSERRSIIDPALTRLTGVLLKSALRQLARHLKTPSGIFVALMVVGTVGMGLMPMIVASQTGSLDGIQMYSTVTSTIPLMMLVIVAMAVYFDIGQQITELRPPELQFVLAGPFSDHQILSYRLMTLAMTWVVSSCLMAVFALPGAGSYPSAVLAIYTGGMTVTALTTLHAISKPVLNSTVRTLVASALLGAVALLLITSLPLGMSDAGFSWQAWLLGCQSSMLGTVMTLPFLAFGKLLSAPLGMAMLGWTCVCLATLVVGFGACYWVNVGFAELAVEGVSRKQVRIQRFRSGQFGRLNKTEHRSTWRLFEFPWWGGIGPVAWHQVTFAVRRNGKLLFGLVCVGLVTGVVLMVLPFFRPETIHAHFREWSMPIAMVASTYLGFLLTLSQPIGMAMTPKTLTWFRMLPCRPIAIVIGMLAGQLVILFAIRLAFAVVAAFVTTRGWGENLAVLLAGLGLDVAYGSAINLVTAATVLRAMPSGTPDVLQGGRAMLYMFVLAVGMVPSFLAAGVAGGTAAVMTDMDRQVIAIAVGAGLLAVQPVIWWVTAVFFRDRELFQGD